MSYDYSPLAQTAERMIDRFGKDATLRKAGAAVGDPWNPSPGAPTDHDVRVVEFNERVRDRSGTLVGQTVKTLYIAGMIEPVKADQIEVGGSVYEIDAVRELSPGETTLMWEVDILNG